VVALATFLVVRSECLLASAVKPAMSHSLAGLSSPLAARVDKTRRAPLTVCDRETCLWNAKTNASVLPWNVSDERRRRTQADFAIARIGVAQSAIVADAIAVPTRPCTVDQRGTTPREMDRRPRAVSRERPTTVT
jgi:hypothetical protein